MQASLINKAKKLGISTLVLDNNPKCSSRYLSDKFECVDPFDLKGVLKSVKHYDIIGAMTLEESTVAAACQIIDALGLPSQGWGIGPCVTDKHVMRQRFKKYNIQSPEYFKISHGDLSHHAKAWASDMLRYGALIAKPSDRNGSLGTTVIRDISQYEGALEKAFRCSRNGKILLERFIDGPEFGAQCFCIDGKMELCMISKKTVSSNLKTIGHSYSADLSGQLQDRIRRECAKALKSLGIVNGPSTIDIRIDSAGDPYILEIGARIGGTRLPQVIAAHNGIDLLDISIRLAVGQKVILTPPDRLHTNPAAVLLIHYAQRGKVMKMDVAESLGTAYEPLDHRIKIKPGTRIDPDEFYGYVLCRGRNAADRCEYWVSELKHHIVIE